MYYGGLPVSGTHRDGECPQGGTQTAIQTRPGSSSPPQLTNECCVWSCPIQPPHVLGLLCDLWGTSLYTGSGWPPALISGPKRRGGEPKSLRAERPTVPDHVSSTKCPPPGAASLTALALVSAARSSREIFPARARTLVPLSPRHQTGSAPETWLLVLARASGISLFLSQPPPW